MVHLRGENLVPWKCCVSLVAIKSNIAHRPVFTVIRMYVCMAHAPYKDKLYGKAGIIVAYNHKRRIELERCYWVSHEFQYSWSNTNLSKQVYIIYVPPYVVTNLTIGQQWWLIASEPFFNILILFHSCRTVNASHYRSINTVHFATFHWCCLASYIT